ncbi:hypothetical protein [Porticoccus sp.]
MNVELAQIICRKGPHFVYVLGLALCLCQPHWPKALSDEFLAPSTLYRGDSRQHPGFSTLNNRQLSQRAEDIRSQSMNAQHRALNYQWLQSYQRNEFVEGDKALQMFLKRGLKDYWDRQRREHFHDNRHIPDLDGRGRITRELDYDLRLSSDELEIGLSYEF